ncbi:hypothetical protein HYP07_gp109 [Vibrio phage JSF3]|uniref:Uncharacterized protein n=1 Tax=Vibrio phage JA-1 TaxID=1283071 RepID=R9R4N4_9CAUD|nr:hypothetical protein M612_gp02 [Vibrio phage JA-1]YP_009876334.1 hypothetical protein HYP07_gp109 [Vibrio phage JSF3]AGI61756.1 hypothetical protein JA1_0002 [Vibrio phage JA-1]APD18121.1 hypothetical protein [Vibrio phage JSF3]
MNNVEKLAHIENLIETYKQQLHEIYEQEWSEAVAPTKTPEEWRNYREPLLKKVDAAKELRKHYSNLVILDIQDWD